MATIKEMLTANTADVLEATELLKVLGDRDGQYVWKQLTAEGGDFVAFVTADDENSYPDKGTQDGHWYELVEEDSGITPEMFGYTKMAIDKFTASADGYSAVTIPHSLNEKPMYFILVLADISSIINYKATMICGRRTTDATPNSYCEVFRKNGSHEYTPDTGSVVYSTSNIKITTTTNDKIAGGVEYTLITMA